jgi:GNAT superfamily N-acetyltransferase
MTVGRHGHAVAMSHHLRRRHMLARLGACTRVPVVGMRSPLASDIPGLAALMHAAYHGTTDDEGETEADALIEVQKTFAGEYGAFDPNCSRIVVNRGESLSATLVTRWQDRPFVAFSMTAPTSKRTGLARACLIDVMQDLLAHGERELRLVVTSANVPARSLYESLGFVAEE